MCVSAAQDRAGHRRISYKNIAFFNIIYLESTKHDCLQFEGQPPMSSQLAPPSHQPQHRGSISCKLSASPVYPAISMEIEAGSTSWMLSFFCFLICTVRFLPKTISCCTGATCQHHSFQSTTMVVTQHLHLPRQERVKSAESLWIHALLMTSAVC